MKRGKPLKRTPFKASQSTLKRSQLNHRSQKQENIYKERRELVKELLTSNPSCQACVIFYSFDKLKDDPTSKLGVVRVNPTRDLHEIINRSQGGSILDRRNIITVCRPCHTRITTNPKEAEILGLHMESWCNTDTHFNEALRVRNSWVNGIQSKPYWMADNV